MARASAWTLSCRGGARARRPDAGWQRTAFRRIRVRGRSAGIAKREAAMAGQEAGELEYLTLAGRAEEPGRRVMLAREAGGRGVSVVVPVGFGAEVSYDAAARAAVCELPGGERLTVRERVEPSQATPAWLASLPLGVTVVYEAVGGLAE